MDNIGGDKDRLSQTHPWQILSPNRTQVVIYEIFQYVVRIR